MKAKRKFDKSAKERQSKRDYTASLTLGQRYVVKELKALFEDTKEEDASGEIAVLESAFRKPITSAVKKELNLLRRNSVTGDNLLQALKKIYFRHKLGDKEEKISRAGQEVPRIVCSMALV